jgi:DNA-binding MarR family transcriptional regulator
LNHDEIISDKDNTIFDSNRKKTILFSILTEKGVALAKSISAIEQRVLKEVRNGISDEELIIFYRTLEKFNGNLKKIAEDM